MELRQNTVRIEARYGDQIENGFGFIVGENVSGLLYAVTAWHVVKPPDEPGEHTASVRVELYDHQGVMLDAKVLGTHDVAHDLAVITFPAPDENFTWIDDCLGTAEDENALTEVWFVGKSRRWSVPTSPGTIASEEPLDSRIDIENLSVRPGSSGGPLVSSSGIVGMVLNDSVENTEALSIRFIGRQFKRWNHPFTLKNSALDETAAADAAAGSSTANVAQTVPVAPPSAEGPLVEGLVLQVVPVAQVTHAGGLAAMNGPGVALVVQGHVRLAEATGVQITIAFAFSDGSVVVSRPEENVYRDVRDANKRVISFSNWTEMTAGVLDLSTIRIDPIPFAAFSARLGGGTQYQSTYAAVATAHLNVGYRLVASSAPVPFVVRW